MIEVAPLKYGVVFKKAFSKKNVFNQFVRDVVQREVNVEELYQEYEYKDQVGKVAIKYDLFGEDKENRVIIEIQQLKQGDFFDRFMYYHIISMAEQVTSYIDYTFDKTVYTIVVLTSVPRDKTIDFSMGVVDMDIKNEEGKSQGVYKHKLIFLDPRLGRVNKLISSSGEVILFSGKKRRAMRSRSYVSEKRRSQETKGLARGERNLLTRPSFSPDHSVKRGA